MPKTTHQPFRTCILCRKKLPKADLYRFVWAEEKLLLDLTQKRAGRGAYLCAYCLIKKEDPKVEERLKKALRVKIKR